MLIDYLQNTFNSSFTNTSNFILAEIMMQQNATNACKLNKKLDKSYYNCIGENIPKKGLECDPRKKSIKFKYATQHSPTNFLVFNIFSAVAVTNGRIFFFFQNSRNKQLVP